MILRPKYIPSPVRGPSLFVELLFYILILSHMYLIELRRLLGETQ